MSISGGTIQSRRVKYRPSETDCSFLLSLLPLLCVVCIYHFNVHNVPSLDVSAGLMCLDPFVGHQAQGFQMSSKGSASQVAANVKPMVIYVFSECPQLQV